MMPTARVYRNVRTIAAMTGPSASRPAIGGLDRVLALVVGIVFIEQIGRRSSPGIIARCQAEIVRPAAAGAAGWTIMG
jgi:hypothetical protein